MCVGFDTTPRAPCCFRCMVLVAGSRFSFAVDVELANPNGWPGYPLKETIYFSQRGSSKLRSSVEHRTAGAR